MPTTLAPDEAAITDRAIVDQVRRIKVAFACLRMETRGRGQPCIEHGFTNDVRDYLLRARRLALCLV